MKKNKCLLNKAKDAIGLNNDKISKSIDKLNSEFDYIKQNLKNYLTSINTTISINDLKYKIYQSFNLNDFQEKWHNNIIEDILYVLNNIHISEIQSFYEREQIEEEIKDINYYGKSEDIWRNIIKKKMNSNNSGLLNKVLYSPQRTLFLNFNYTDTLNKYKENFIVSFRDSQIINIHGELKDCENPMIFGYGDELAEDYKVIENLNDNRYLQNVKSTNYLQTDNYKKLLSFIDSEPYQIFIMGHSCGTSDKTLLNTLFEHDNCASIKTFYYQYRDKKDNEIKDNYTDMVQNISRIFKNKPLMRKLVVNKKYCHPLVKCES